MDNYVLHFDGSCWPNPGGKAAYGFMLSNNGKVISSGHGIVATSGKTSNNVAEHASLCKGLQAFMDCNPVSGSILTVYGDSDLVIGQMSGRFGARSNTLYYPNYLESKRLHTLAVNNLKAQIIYIWIPRELNGNCDKLSKID